MNLIAEIVSLWGCESQVPALLIACAPGAHPVIPGAGGFRKARQARRGKGKSGGLPVVHFFLADPERFSWLPFTPNRER
jgi:hypothetical protein